MGEAGGGHFYDDDDEPVMSPQDLEGFKAALQLAREVAAEQGEPG